MNVTEKQKIILLNYMKENEDFARGRLRYQSGNKKILVSIIYIYHQYRRIIIYVFIIINKYVITNKLINFVYAERYVDCYHYSIKREWKWTTKTTQRMAKGIYERNYILY